MGTRDKWDGWVAVAWLAAFVVIIGAALFVYNYGFLRVGLWSGGGRTEPNILVWAAAITNSIVAVLFAIMFSMLNSIYKNGYDILHPKTEKEVTVAPTEVAGDFQGLLVRRVGNLSPLEGHMRSGYRLISINGHAAINENIALKSVIEGVNVFTMTDCNGNRVTKKILMNPGNLGITFDT